MYIYIIKRSVIISKSYISIEIEGVFWYNVYEERRGVNLLLCLGIIEDALEKSIIHKNYDQTDNPFVLERHEIFRKGTVYNTGVLYLARACSLPEVFIAQADSAMICIGMPPEAYKNSTLRIFALDDSTEVEDLSNEINRIFFEYNTLELKLQDSVNKGSSIQHMVEIMTPYMNGNEILVINNDYRLVGKSNKILHFNEISGVGQPDEDDYLPPDIVTYFKNDIIFSKVRDLTEPFIYEASIFSRRGLCMNVFFRGEYACRVVLSEDTNDFRGYETGLVKFFTSFIQIVYDLSAGGNNILPSDSLSGIIIDLLNVEPVENLRLQNSFSQRGWELKSDFYCALLMPSDRDFYNRTIRYYCQTFNREISGCCFVEFDGEIVCLINLNYYGGLLENFISKNLEAFREVYFRIGYSNRFGKIEDFHNYFLQAKIALKTGLKLYPFQWHNKFSDLVLSYMEAKLTEELDGRFLCAPEVMILNEYDEAHQNDLLRTLHTYLCNNLNAVKTAKDLFIHRSTMVYRLERITELTGIDFKDPRKILYLLLSVELLLKD